MQRLVDEGKLAGVVTLVARHGKIAHFHTVGTKDILTRDAIEKDSIFRIYSMTKPITGVAMMILYEEGKWRLNDPVSNYIPAFAKLEVYTGENRNGRPILENATRSMTMRELMTHSAGLAYGSGDTNPVDRMYRETRVLDGSAPLQVMIDKLATLPLLAQPGTRWYYSIAVDVQGYLVEKLSGQAFPEFLQQRVFEPLGMKDTAFYVPKEKIGRLAMTHTQDKNGKLLPPSAAVRSQIVRTLPAGPSGGGGLYSTAEDYARFGQMLLDGGELNGARVLAPRTVKMMRTNHLMAEPLSTFRAGTGFGLDVAVVHDAAAAGEPYANGSFYWTGAAGTWFWIDPATDLVFVGMIQHEGPAVGEVQGLSRNLTYQSIVDPVR
jgi:CubicO group peptidase (beta-lactamase class C family)